MVKAVGLKNLLVHEYGKIDLKQVFQFAQKDIHDLDEYILSILKDVR